MSIKILAMSFDKEKAESEVTDALVKITKQIGMLLSIKNNSKLEREWLDEMTHKWIRNLSTYGANVKTSKGVLSLKMWKRLLVQTVTETNVRAGIRLVCEHHAYKKANTFDKKHLMSMGLDPLLDQVKRALLFNLGLILEDQVRNDVVIETGLRAVVHHFQFHLHL